MHIVMYLHNLFMFWYSLSLFFLRYIVCLLFFRYNALCIVINFIHFSSIFLSSSFNNGLEYLTKGMAWICYLRNVFSSDCFRDDFSFFSGTLIYSFISVCLILSTFNIAKYLLFSISTIVLIFSYLRRSFPSVICFFFQLFMMRRAHFSMFNSIPISSYLPTPPLGQDMTLGWFLSGV